MQNVDRLKNKRRQIKCTKYTRRLSKSMMKNPKKNTSRMASIKKSKATPVPGKRELKEWKDRRKTSSRIENCSHIARKHIEKITVQNNVSIPTILNGVCELEQVSRSCVFIMYFSMTGNQAKSLSLRHHQKSLSKYSSVSKLNIIAWHLQKTTISHLSRRELR